MATYATQQDIVDLYGVDLLVRVADHDRDGTPDPTIVSNGLEAADSIINAYLSAQYPIPVTPVPEIVKTCAIDIAVYKMALGRVQRTDEMRVRYEDALSLLEKIAKGTIGLGNVSTDTDGDGVVDPSMTRRGRFLNVSRA